MAKKNNRSNAYAQSGVDYSKLDRLKLSAQQAALTTNQNIADTPYRELTTSRGESAYVIEADDHYLAIVQEGLGTKNLVADAVRSFSGKTHYDALAIDTVAMIVNDLITVGARPLVVQQYLACGSPEWLDDEERLHDLVTGWKFACDEVEANWGGGETPGLKGVLQENVVDLAGNAVGIISPKEHLLMGNKIQASDAIIGFASSGIHANGVSLARTIASELPNGYATTMSSGTTFGEALLAPTVLYSKLLQQLFKKNIPVHYAVNVTGHGWRKLMRPVESFSYEINTVVPVPEVLSFLQTKAKLSDYDAYATFNMGLGFCVYVPANVADKVIHIAQDLSIPAWNIGTIITSSKKSVVIKPLNITYEADELHIR